MEVFVLVFLGERGTKTRFIMDRRRESDVSYTSNGPGNRYFNEPGDGARVNSGSDNKNGSLLSSFIEGQGEYDGHVEFKPTEGEILNEQFAMYLTDVEREYMGLGRMWKIR